MWLWQTTEGYLPNVNAVWCQSPKPEYKLETQRYVQPARCIPLVRSGTDLIVLPGGHAPTQEFWDFHLSLHANMREEQAIFTAGRHFCMDDDMDPLTVAHLRRQILKQPNACWLLIPYAPTPNFLRWAEPMAAGLQKDGVKIFIFREDPQWLATYGDKGMLHRHMDSLDRPSVIERIDKSISVPRGYVCKTRQELLDARRLLADVNVCIKPLAGATGEGIILDASQQHLDTYDFPMGPVNLEEMLHLDLDENKQAISPAMHYLGGEIIGEHMVDQVMQGAAYIGWRRSTVSPNFSEVAQQAMHKFLRKALPCGPGGFDFLSVDGQPFLTDINTGRFNGAHAPKIFHTKYRSPNCNEFLCTKIEVPSSMSVHDVWSILQDSGLALTPEHGGAFPIMFLRGLKAQLCVFANDCDSAKQILRRAKGLLSRSTANHGLIPKVADCS